MEREDAVLFSESLCRFVVEVRPSHEGALNAALEGLPHATVGRVDDSDVLSIRRRDQTDVTIRVSDLEAAWRGPLVTSPAHERPPIARRARPERAVPAESGPVRVLLLHATGTNRDRDAALACEMAGAQPEVVHVNQLLSGERSLLDYHMLVVPGGFSYGDDLGGGKLWALDLRHRLGETVNRFVASGRPVLGICNGFQALVKAGLLPGPDWLSGSESNGPNGSMAHVTLTHNTSGRFECRWVYLQPNPHSPCIFTEGLTDLIYCPVAHGEGRLVACDEATLIGLWNDGLAVLTYVHADGSPAGYPACPNGSDLGIAGLCNPAGNILGLMPHPENHIFAWQHPRWRRGERGMTGLRLFQNGIRYARR
jgi:phosphoribosylformylglycinamidine synthase